MDLQYLGGSIGVDGDHVLGSLFDLELYVELSLQGRDALLLGAGPALSPRRLGTLVYWREVDFISCLLFAQLTNLLQLYFTAVVYVQLCM